MSVEAPARHEPIPAPLKTRTRARQVFWAAAVLLLVLMALSTKVVSSNSKAGSGDSAFSPASFATKTFPKVQRTIVAQAVDAPTLAKALKTDAASAKKKYANDASGQPVFSVNFTGKVGKGTDGIFPVAVASMPKGVQVRLQTGPAIDGTDVRDATKLVTFPQFRNQIEYQDAGAALNDRIKQDVLGSIDRGSLTGKKVTVTGAFTLINPAAWLVTPVKLEVS